MELFKQITANNIELKEYAFWKELAMEAYLLENEEILKLDKENFNDVTILDAEIALEKGRKNGNGRIDLLAKYSGEYLGIIEIKLKEINESCLQQLEDYLDQRERLLKKHPEYWTENTSPKWVGVLVGSDISNNLREKLSQGYEYNGIPLAGMTLKRFRSSNGEIYVISDTYFKYKYLSKDYSKFIFNHQEYNKGRLVNAVIKNYVENNPDITYSELKSKFPNKIQGSFGVFDTKDNAIDKYQRWGHKRHYINPDEVIKLNDCIIATCTQWNPENINRFINCSNELGLKIEIK
ncbi:hypothetical protein OZ668_09105 [Elizabethkingia sp. HX XZB]|uniref:hypothetical protein n=1 Tax=Elizabethkingia sp. HX XZB TaxID=3003193 RepID=UPI002A24D555|nr:hypothetical protein [Elizabethkingia sp. HX XZB]MDX8568142.1 hypothetical protein [Elizabethkingia sp. HX XZB]